MSGMGNIAFDFFMSPLIHMEDIKENEKTKLSIVYHQDRRISCVLRICKNRDLSFVCEALCKIRNPGAVVVYGYVYENGDTYILEEYLDGRTIEKIMEDEGVFTEDKVARIIIEVCKALEVLHRERPPIVHNDINISNIMICEDGRVKLFDFDISRLYKKGQNQNTTLFGTEEYASPEHFGYGQSEPRTDIYCLGVTMHKMLTNNGLTNEHRMTYQGKLERILSKCLAFDPKNRYTSVSALRRDLERFLSRKKIVFRKVCGIIAAVLLITGTVKCVQLYGDLMVDVLGYVGDFTELDSDRNAAQEDNLSENAMQSETTPGDNDVNLTEPAVTAAAQQDRISDPQTNDSRSNAQMLILNQEYLEAIEADGVADWYGFQTTENLSVYRIWIQPQLGPPCVNVSLYDEIGIKVNEVDVYPSNEEKAFLDLYLEAGKKYYIKVSAANIVDYRICVYERVCDAGINQDSATRILLNKRHFAVADSTLPDWYMFEVPEDGSYVITCHNINVGAPVKGYGSTYMGRAEHEDNFTYRSSMKKGEQFYFCILSPSAEANGTYIIEITTE